MEDIGILKKIINRQLDKMDIESVDNMEIVILKSERVIDQIELWWVYHQR